MKVRNYIAASLLLASLGMTSAFGFDMNGIELINPLENNQSTYLEEINQPSFDLKKMSLTKNSIKNQYTIAMDKFMQSNVRSSYRDFQILIDNVMPNDYIYMRLSKEMASIGFFSLAELAISKIADNSVSSLLEEDVKNFYFPNYTLTHKDQIYLAEIYANIMYNDQSQEATGELLKQTTLLMESDYANYLVAFGSLKNGDIKQAQKSIDEAIKDFVQKFMLNLTNRRMV